MTPTGPTRRLKPFEAAEARTALVRKIVDGESKALDVRTIKLRALRLAKEEADRAEALANPPPPPIKKPRKPRAKAA
jgi:hypothetical protein